MSSFEQPSDRRIARVAIDNAALRFDRLYSYLLPDSMSYASVGARVAVPFGNGNKLRVGIILGFDDEYDESYKKIVYCEESPILDSEQLELIFWLKENTFCGYFDAVKVLLPKLSRAVVKNGSGGSILLEQSKGYTETIYAPTGVGEATKRMSEIISAVPQSGATYAEISSLTGASRDTINRMTERGLLAKAQRNREKPIYTDYKKRTDGYTLFDEQRVAYEKIVSRISLKKNETLLHGVTSSGKTVIYIKLMEYMLSVGRSVILLVPEIALATQTILRLRELFGEEVAVIHSGLSDTERQLQWMKIKNGFCRIVVGTRSAVFAPADSLGLIIIDEEQEAAYSSEQSPRYNAVSVAKHRATLCGAHLLLSSATPSVCDYFHAQSTGSIVKLEKRYMSMPLPRVITVDMRAELLSGNTGVISEQLAQLIRDRLSKKEQVMLLLNRRGYFPVSICTECKEIQKCPQCDVPLVFHKPSGNMVCHYCFRHEPAEGVCRKCGAALSFKGVGTQRAEEQIAALFPEARVLRLDTDAAGKKGEYETKLNDFQNGNYDIIIGTQMIAKGLDFSNVTLAAVLSVDQQLLMQDYKVYERCFAMLTQLVGRSGRGEAAGSAVIQTVDPENSVIRYAVEQDYDSFYNTEITLRKACLYPPFCALYTIGFVSDKEKPAYDAAAAMAQTIKALVNQQANIPVRVLGPAAFRVGRVMGAYRVKLTVKCRGDKRWNDLLEKALECFYSMKEYSEVRCFVDVNSDGDY